MLLRAYAPGDGSIDFCWESEQNPNGESVDEPVTESDVSEFLRMEENSSRFKGHEIIVFGRKNHNIPYDVRIAKVVQRPFGSSKKLVMDDTTYEYAYHGDEDAHFRNYHSGNTDFYATYEDGSRDKIYNLSILASLCFFLCHEKDFEVNGIQVRGTKRDAQRQADRRRGLHRVPQSIVGQCVGHHPDRKIYREVETLGDDLMPREKRLVKAHPATSIEEGDYWKR